MSSIHYPHHIFVDSYSLFLFFLVDDNNTRSTNLSSLLAINDSSFSGYKPWLQTINGYDLSQPQPSAGLLPRGHGLRQVAPELALLGGLGSRATGGAGAAEGLGAGGAGSSPEAWPKLRGSQWI